MASHDSQRDDLESTNGPEHVIRPRPALAIGVALTVLSCATVLLEWPRPGRGVAPDAVTSTLLDAAQAGSPRALAALRIAIDRRPVGYALALFESLRLRCNARCDGLEEPILETFDRLARAGALRRAWPDSARRPLHPTFKGRTRRGLLVGLPAPGGGLRAFVDPQVARVLVGAIGVGSTTVRSLAELAQSKSVAKALCRAGASIGSGSPELQSLRRAFCTVDGAPSGDVDHLCSMATATGIPILKPGEQKDVERVCAALGAVSSANAVLPPNLAIFAGPACYDLTESDAASRIRPDAVIDAEILDASLECMGVSEAPPGAPESGPIAKRLEFADSSDGSLADDDGPWIMPLAGRDGYSYKYNVLDDRANAENAAHVGDPGFIAVFAVAPSGDATAAVEIVSTSPDGYVAAVILEFFTDPEDVDFEVAFAATKAIRAAVQALKQVYPPRPDPSASPSASASPSPSESDSPSPSESESPSPTETPEPSASTDGTDRTFGGPGSKSEACQRLTDLVLRGPYGAPLRGAPGTSRPPADPRATHGRDDAEAAPSATCQADAQPSVCGAIDCAAGLHLDARTCACSRSHSFEADPALGCSALRCTDGSHGEAVGPGCVCASDEGRVLSRPAAPTGPGMGTRGWGVRARRL